MRHELANYAALIVLGVTALQTDDARGQNGRTEDVRAFFAIIESDYALSNAISQAATEEERISLKVKQEAERKQLHPKLMTLAESYPETVGALAALYGASFLQPVPETRPSATQLFLKQASNVNTEQLARAISIGRSASSEKGVNPEIARYLMTRVKGEPHDAMAADLLIGACRLTMGDEDDAQPSSEFIEAADLIELNYAASPSLCNFCELLESRKWGGMFERHLKTLLEKNEDRAVRCAAAFALPAVIQLTTGDRQTEAADMYERFLADFDGTHEYHYQDIENDRRLSAARELNRLKHCPINAAAPEINGTDLEGQRLVLSDYRGKVVLLSFWATWCKPCLECIPHEKSLTEKFAKEGFVILGVNGDSDTKQAHITAAKCGITWRSFCDEWSGTERISAEWSIHGWPTFYLIDRDGIIRRRFWGQFLSFAEIEAAIQQLLAEDRSHSEDRD